MASILSEKDESVDWNQETVQVNKRYTQGGAVVT